MSKRKKPNLPITPKATALESPIKRKHEDVFGMGRLEILQHLGSGYVITIDDEWLTVWESEEDRVAQQEAGTCDPLHSISLWP